MQSVVVNLEQMISITIRHARYQVLERASVARAVLEVDVPSSSAIYPKKSEEIIVRYVLSSSATVLGIQFAQAVRDLLHQNLDDIFRSRFLAARPHVVCGDGHLTNLKVHYGTRRRKKVPDRTEMTRIIAFQAFQYIRKLKRSTKGL